MELRILEQHRNYTCQVIKLPSKQRVEGLDNLVKVTHQGNDVLTSKDAQEDTLYLFFPSECQIADAYLSINNNFRNSSNNFDNTKKGYFEDSCRVKAIRFKGVISTGYIAPINTLKPLIKDNIIDDLRVGDEFNIIDGFELCKKYVIKLKGGGANLGKVFKVIDGLVDSKLAPEHFSTEHLLKNVYKLKLDDYIAVTHKLHGTSARYFNTLTHKKLKWYEKLLIKLGVNVEFL